MDLFYAHAHLEDVFNGGTMDNTEQTLSIGASQIATSQNGDGLEISPELHNVRIMKDLGKEPASEDPCVNGRFKDSSDTVDDALLNSVTDVSSSETKKVTNLCNGESNESAEEEKPQSNDDEILAEIDDDSDIFASPNEKSEKQEEEEDLAEISDDDIICDDDKNETKGEKRIADAKKQLMYENKESLNGNNEMVQQIKMDKENNEDFTETSGDLKSENDLFKEAKEIPDMPIDTEINKSGCDNIEDQEQISGTEKSETSKLNSTSFDESWTTVETLDESIEMSSERDTGHQHINTSSQSITSENDAPQLLLELSHNSGESEPKLVPEKLEIKASANSNDIHKLEEKSEKEDSEFDAFMEEISCSIQETSTNKKEKAVNGENDQDTGVVQSVTAIDIKDVEDKSISKQVPDKSNTDKNSDSEVVIKSDECNAMEVDSISCPKSDETEQNVVEKENKCDVSVESITKHSHITKTVAETAEKSGTGVKLDEVKESVTDSKDVVNKYNKSDLFKKDEGVLDSIVKDIVTAKSESRASDSKVLSFGLQKAKKLDQLLSKIASKAELVKTNDSTVPKKAKARKSCASSSNSVRSSSSSSSALPVSTSLTNLTFNVKELEKRGVLDMPKLQKRKAFDPIKIKPVEQRLHPTDDLLDPSYAKYSKQEPVISPVKSPTKSDHPFFNKNKIIKGRRRKGKRSGKYRLPGEKVNKRTQNSRKKESEERQLSDSDGKTTVASSMSVTDKVKKSQQLEYKRDEHWEVVSVTGDKSEDYSARNAFNKSLGLSRKAKTNGIDSESGVKQNALDIMTKNSRLSFTATPSSNMKKAKKSVWHSIDSTTHRTLDSFLKGATYSQMNSSLKLNADEIAGKKKVDESQNSGSGDARKRKASESPSQTNSSTEGSLTGQEEKKRKVDGLTSPVQTKMITLVPAGSPPVAMPVSGATHPIIISPGSTTGTQTLIQNGTINGLPMFQLVSNPANSTSQPPQLLAIAQNQGSTHSLPGNTFLQPKGGMPLLLTPVPMTSLMTSVAGSQNSASATQTTTVNSFGNQVVSVGSVFPPLSHSKTLLKHLISPQLKSQLPNGQFLDVKQLSKQGTGLNGLYPVTPPRTPDEQLSETNSHDSVEVSPGGVVPPDKDVIPLCTCKISGASFQRMASAVTFCQSLDSVDGKVMGCCNKVTNMQLVRPAVKIPFLAVCEGHKKRLRAHQCCPGCGHYCTQGKFLQCKKEGGNSAHLFHEQCQVTKDGKNFCPHCGETSAQFEVHLTIQEHKPSILKDNKPSRTQKTARILMNEKKTGEGDDSDEEKSEDKAKKLPTSSEITIGPDRYSLERFLNSLDGERPKKYRHLPKCLYTPAYDNDLERVVYMLEDGHDANETYDDLEGQGALHAAAIVGSLPIVHILVQSGASPHIQDKSLRTPLMYASENNHPEVVSYLLRAGAVVNAKADDGMTSLHYSSKMGHISIIKQLLETEQVKIDITDDGGWTPLIWATEHRELESVKLLLKRNADPNLRDSEENTTLHWAAFAGSVAIVELLLTAGCDLDSLNMHGDRPLHIAARQDHYECVVLFLARGADVEAKNNKGETPLECCLDQNSAVYLALKVNKQLKKFGAKHMGRPEKLLHRDLSKGRENIPIPCVNKVDDDGIPQDYLYVTDNIETTNLHINRVIGSLQSCQCKDDCSSIYCACGKNSVKCWYDKFGRLLSEFNMLEPPLIFECNRACECWTTCNNRVVQNGVMSRLQVFKTEGRGWGCRTLVDIPRGTFICEYIGEHISDSEADRREDDSYLFDLDNRDGETYCIDARRYGNIARFINHLCEPNLVPVKVFVDSQDLRFPRICLFASRDIIAQEELGFDYGEKFWIIKWKQFTCTCGSVKCRYSTETIQKTLEEYRQRHEDEAEINPE